MALTVNQYFNPGSPAAPFMPGAESWGVIELFGDTSYPAGGYSLSGVLPFSLLRLFLPVATNIGLAAMWDQVNQKIKVFYPTGGGQPAPAAIADPIAGAGATAVTSTAATASIVPGQGKEVASATNLSTLKIYALYWGRV